MTTSTEAAINEIFHTVERLRERYNLNIVPTEYHQACEDIRHAHQAVRLYRWSEWRTVWLVLIKGRAVPVVYNQKTGNIATALPLRALRNNQAIPAVSEFISRVAHQQAVHTHN